MLVYLSSRKEVMIKLNKHTGEDVVFFLIPRSICCLTLSPVQSRDAKRDFRWNGMKTLLSWITCLELHYYTCGGSLLQVIASSWTTMLPWFCHFLKIPLVFFWGYVLYQNLVQHNQSREKFGLYMVWYKDIALFR